MSTAFATDFLRGVLKASEQYADIDVGVEDCVRLYIRHDRPEYLCVVDALAEACSRLAFVEGALEAGIPMSVIEGKTTLRDHFSQADIDDMCGRKKA